MKTSISPQRDLKWIRDVLDTIPTWTIQLDMLIVLSFALPHLSSDNYRISIFAEGAFNKLYLISAAFLLSPSYLLRVVLPVDSYFKTSSQVATLAYLSYHTSIPVPRVIAYDASTENLVGVEWILMTRSDGVAIKGLWSSPELSW